MKSKLTIYISLSTMALIMQVVWLTVLVAGITLLDISLGVFVVWRLKEERFDWFRFLEGFLKIIFYSFCIGLSYMISEQIFDGNLFDIEHLLPKIAAMLFVTLEVKSIDKKRVRLGKKPILETLRGIVKVVKEFYKSFSSITSLSESKEV